MLRSPFAGAYRSLGGILSEAETEPAIVDGAANLKQKIGSSSRPAHMLRLFIRLALERSPA
jgi:hypothetical protein